MNTSKAESIAVRVLKTGTCKTVSEKSTLTYEIGISTDEEIHFRVKANTGAGFFSPEWIALKDIRHTLEKRPKGTTVTSYLLQSLFNGKSVNTPAFLAAVLVQEKVLRPLANKKRHFELTDPADFAARIEKLMSSNVDVKIKDTAGTTKKTAGKKQSSTSKTKTLRES